jgi:hypothetical protein
MPSQIGQRLAFQNASNAIKRAGLNAGRAVLSQSYLRLETPISATATSYKLDVLTTENTQPATYPTQLKLALQDAFVISTLFVGIYAPNDGSATGSTTTTPLSYPTIGNIAGTAGNCIAADSNKLLGIYNGFLQLNVNQRTILTGWDLYRHLRVQQTQTNVTSSQSGGITSGGGVYSPTAPIHYSYDSIDGSSDGFYPVEPNIVLDGSKKNDLTITLPYALGAFTSNYNYRFCVIARGILAQNVSAVN